MKKWDVSNAIRQYMHDYMELWPFSGVIQVVKNGQVVASEAYGEACLEFAVLNTMETRFSLASG